MLSYLPGKDAAKGSISFSVCNVLTFQFCVLFWFLFYWALKL